MPRDAQGTAPGCAQRNTAAFGSFVILNYKVYFELAKFLLNDQLSDRRTDPCKGEGREWREARHGRA